MTLLRHKRQQHWHTWGIFKQTLMNVVDNSALGRKAMAEGKPPRYSRDLVKEDILMYAISG